MTILIKKFRLREGMFANIEYDETEASITDNVQKICNNPVHDDLKEKLQDLAVHCVLICEFTDVTKVKSISTFHGPILEFIKVRGVSLDPTGVCISFERKLTTGRVLNINTPHTKYSDENIKYKFDRELQVSVEALEAEIQLYMNGKYGAGAQMKLEFAEAEMEEEHA